MFHIIYLHVKVFSMQQANVLSINKFFHLGSKIHGLFTGAKLLFDNIRGLPKYPRYAQSAFDKAVVSVLGTQSAALSSAFAEFEAGGAEAAFNSAFLRRFMKKCAELPGECIAEYSLARDICAPAIAVVKKLPEYDPQDVCKGTYETSVLAQYGGAGVRFSNRFCDATFSFCLLCRGRPIAYIGFNAIGSAIRITQIQGVHGRSLYLAPIRWEHALVEYVVEWAQKHGIPRVEIESGTRNDWVRAGHISIQQAKLRYDVTAKKCGFKKDDRGIWFKLFVDADMQQPVAVSSSSIA